MNDSRGNVAAHYAPVKEKFEYSNYSDRDEEIFKNACNMTALNKRLKKKSIIAGGKGSSSSNTEQQKLKEEGRRIQNTSGGSKEISS